MEVNVRFLDNLRLEAKFDDFTIITDQPIRYKGDGLAPSPFDYFLASSALCAAYFVRVYCKARNIPTHDIKISQNNSIDPENRYNQTFHITAELPESLSAKDRKGILAAMDRCTVKKVIQAGPQFQIDDVHHLASDSSTFAAINRDPDKRTMIPGKDAPLEETMGQMMAALADLGIQIEIASWRNIVPHVWSVHIRDAASPLCFTNGKGATKEAAMCSAIGEYLERISCNYFYNDFYLGPEFADSDFVHYPDERWFPLGDEDEIPDGLMDHHLLSLYNPRDELRGSNLLDTNSGLIQRGICAQPFIRHSDGQTVYIPVGLVGNLFVSNGMSAGNSKFEARVQCLSEILERSVKKEIIEGELCLPEVPREVLQRYPHIISGIEKLEEKGFPVLVKDASLNGRYPVMCVGIMNPKTGGVFTSFGAHPKWEVALERSLTELLQGRSFEGLDDVPLPTFNSQAITEPNNFVEHFIDSTGLVSWKFFGAHSDFDFCEWDVAGSTEDEWNYLVGIIEGLHKELYIADYQDFGTHACRILVPGYSEIYPIDDLIWDNTNKALDVRSDILSLHSLQDEELRELRDYLEQSDIDNYTLIPELIGVAFEDNSPWGLLTVIELNLLISLAIRDFEEAKDLTNQYLNFNENSQQRNLFYQALAAVLHIRLDSQLHLDNFKPNLERMFGQEILAMAVESVYGSLKFPGLMKTDVSLTGLYKHQRLLASYRKLHQARSKAKDLRS